MSIRRPLRQRVSAALRPELLDADSWLQQVPKHLRDGKTMSLEFGFLKGPKKESVRARKVRQWSQLLPVPDRHSLS